MAGKEPDIGPTARTVAKNVSRLRGSMNYTQLSERLLEMAGWSINAVGIRRIESGERRVTPDDLMALAVALDVSPATLLMPASDAEDTRVTATGLKSTAEAQAVWAWLGGQKPPWFTGSVAQYISTAWPRWMQDKYFKWEVPDGDD